MDLTFVVPRLRLGTGYLRGSASRRSRGRPSLPTSAFPGGAWERGTYQTSVLVTCCICSRSRDRTRLLAM
jgi:hypothetical protein